MRLVYVEWLDSFGCSSSWQKLDIESCEPMVCKSVGWLLHDGPTCKVIVPHVSGVTNEGCGDMTIPTVAVVRMTDLDVPTPISRTRREREAALRACPDAEDVSGREKGASEDSGKGTGAEGARAESGRGKCQH